jgi:uncharacterized membrane protein
MPEYNRDLEKHRKLLGRILAFSDGVFAFSITLLILDSKLPADTLKPIQSHELLIRGSTRFQSCLDQSVV